VGVSGGVHSIVQGQELVIQLDSGVSIERSSELEFTILDVRNYYVGSSGIYEIRTSSIDLRRCQDYSTWVDSGGFSCERLMEQALSVRPSVFVPMPMIVRSIVLDDN